MEQETSWASVNRGVLVCVECCYVHRSLGRHISQIRSLRRGAWNNSQLELIHTLYNSGANNIWEHALIDPQTANKAKRKPNSSDPVIPRKEAFIKAKYAQHAYAIRASKSEDTCLLDLNRQLWSCARTTRVETTLRLLALGADPNYADSERGNSPLHIAAKEGQALQVELLWIYGADVAQRNVAGHLPADVARQEDYHDLAARLDELEFEVTDRLSMFLCGRRPDHPKGIHFVIPELVSPNNAIVRQFRRQLQTSTSSLFEKLIQDVYDEVDRRETSAQWNALQSASSIGIYDPRHVAVFLPPNPCVSATRNQLRQKLAKYEARDFSQLIIDLLKEARRRFLGLALPAADDVAAIDAGAAALAASNGVIDLDDVDAGRDYDEVPEICYRKSNASNSSRKSSSSKSGSVEKTRSAAATAGAGAAIFDDILELREKLQETNERVAAAAASNSQLSRDMAQLQSVVREMDRDKLEVHGMLRSIQDSVQTLMRRQATSPLGQPPTPVSVRPPAAAAVLGSGVSGVSRPVKEETSVSTATASTTSGRGERTTSGHGERTAAADAQASAVTASATPHAFSVPVHPAGVTFPDNLMGEIEHLIVAIKRFFADIKDADGPINAAFHADSIKFHINRIIDTVPAENETPGLAECVGDIEAAMRALAVKCAERPFNADDASHCAYEVAKAAKRLLVTSNQQSAADDNMQ